LGWAGWIPQSCNNPFPRHPSCATSYAIEWWLQQILRTKILSGIDPQFKIDQSNSSVSQSQPAVASSQQWHPASSGSQQQQW